jgi:hypothetical protein
MNEGVRGQLAHDQLHILGEVRQTVLDEVLTDEVTCLERAGGDDRERCGV